MILTSTDLSSLVDAFFVFIVIARIVGIVLLSLFSLYLNRKKLPKLKKEIKTSFLRNMKN